MKPPKRITAAWLRRHNFCASHTEGFADAYPDGLPFEPESVDQMRNDGHGNSAAAFAEGCYMAADTSPAAICFRISETALRELEREREKRDINDEIALYWWFREHAGSDEIIRFCAWAITRWKRGQ